MPTFILDSFDGKTPATEVELGYDELDVQTLADLVNAGDKEAVAYLNGLSDEQVAALTKKPVTAAGFDESLHARGPGGRFAPTGGSEKDQGARGTGVGVAEHTGSSEELHRFSDAFHNAFPPGDPREGFVSHYSLDEMQSEGMKPLLANDDHTGVLVHDHGDGRVEATALFNTDGSGQGVALLKDAVEHEGVNYVEAFGPALPKLYASLGFVESARSPFDPAQAPAGWNANTYDAPDYVHMVIPGSTAAPPTLALAASAAPSIDYAAIADEMRTEKDDDWIERYGDAAWQAMLVVGGICSSEVADGLHFGQAPPG